VPLDFGGNSEFRPMPLAANGQLSGNLAAQGGVPDGMTLTAARVSDRRRRRMPSFASLGFHLVWNDAPNAARDATAT